MQESRNENGQCPASPGKSHECDGVTGSPMRPVLVITAVCALLYAIFLVEDRQNPTSYQPIIDSREYDDTARAIASGEGAPPYPYWHPPLYPYFLAVVYLLTGGSILAAKIVQAGLGIATCLLCWRLGRRLFGDQVGFVAAIMLAIWGPFLFFSTRLLATGLSVLLNLAALHLVIVAMDRPSWWRWLVAGGVIGLAALALPNILLAMPVLVLWLIVTALRQRAVRPVGYASLCVLGIVVAIAPATIRNYRVSGEFVLISMNGGINFWIGNNPEAYDTMAMRPGREWEQLRHEPNIQGIRRYREADAYFYRKAFAYIRHEPIDFVRGLAVKARWFFHARELPRNMDIYAARDYSSLLQLLTWRWGSAACPFGLVAPFAVLGLVIGARRKRSWPAIVFGAIFSFSIILFFVSSRHRLPIIPIVTIFGALGLQWLHGAITDRRLRAAGGGIALVLVIGVGINLPVRAPGDEVNFRAEAERLLSQRAIELGHPERARFHLERAVRLEPDDADAHLNLASLLLHLEQTSLAGRHYRRAVQLDPDFSEAHHGLGCLAALEQRWTDAADQFRRALAILPVRHDSRYRLAVVLEKQGSLEQAIEELRTGLQLGATEDRYRRRLAQLLVQLGRYDQAEIECRTVLENNPRDPQTLHLMGLIHSDRQDWSRATDYLRQAVSLEPEDPAFRLAWADALNQLGRKGEAIEVTRAALNLAERQGQGNLAEQARMRLRTYQESQPAD